MPHPMIRIDHVSAVYGQGSRQVHALRDVHLTIWPGEIFSLLGANGAGKTTLLACIEGLHRPAQGTIQYTLFWNLSFPVVLLVIFSAVFGSMRIDGQPYMRWVLPGLVVLNIMAFGLIRSATWMVEMRQRGVLRRLHATPVTALLLVGSYVAVNVLLCLLQSAVLMLAAVALYRVPLPLGGLVQAVPMLLLAVLTFVALGQCLSGGLTHIGAAVAVGQVGYYSQMFVTDLFLPLERLPAWLQQVATYLPSCAVIRLVRPPLLGQAWGADLPLYLLVVMGYGVVATLLAARGFRWDPYR